MAHKKLASPSSGALDKVYGDDWNKLIDALQEQVGTNPFTLNMDVHTFKHSSTNQAGDMFVGNGTKLARRARGTANQVWRTNAAATDTEWATLATGGDVTGGANVGSGAGQVFRDKTSNTLNLKTLLAGSNVTITNNANDITIASTAAGGGGGPTLGPLDWVDYQEQASAPANPSTDRARIYMKDIDSNNQGMFALIKKNGAFVEVQII